MEKVILQINEIKCQGCIEKILKAFKKVKGIINIEINIKTKIANIEFNSKKVSKEKIISVVNNLDYNPIEL